jgi:hypothetical protein
VINGEIAFRYSGLGIPKLRSLQGARCEVWAGGKKKNPMVGSY